MIGPLQQLRDLARLNRRLDTVEREVQECRQLNVRLASVTDLVNDLLLDLADTDDPRVAEAVTRYRASVGDVGGGRA